MPKAKNQIIIYKSTDGSSELSVHLENETVWLTIDQMAELFGRNKSTISRHIQNIFEEQELQRNSVVANFATTATDGKIYQVDYYNLDVIISVGYRVKSIQATRFRQWATERLKEYIVKGFTMDDERLKGNGGGNYWKELLNRIRDIRSSNAGKISHTQAKEKAIGEYKKYKAKTLSPVEKDYLSTIKSLEQKAKQGNRSK